MQPAPVTRAAPSERVRPPPISGQPLEGERKTRRAKKEAARRAQRSNWARERVLRRQRIQGQQDDEESREGEKWASRVMILELEHSLSFTAMQVLNEEDSGIALWIDLSNVGTSRERRRRRKQRKNKKEDGGQVDSGTYTIEKLAVERVVGEAAAVEQEIDNDDTVDHDGSSNCGTDNHSVDSSDSSVGKSIDHSFHNGSHNTSLARHRSSSSSGGGGSLFLTVVKRIMCSREE